MSNSISAAKRRRAGNITSSPMFQSNTQPPAAAVSSVETQKPMSLQQVIGVFDKRLLYLEDYVIKQIKKVPEMEVKPPANVSSPTVNMDEITLLMQNMMIEHFTEFNHRYEVLAEEIMNLKHIVMKLQSYTLDVNKTLIEERIQLLSDISSEKTNNMGNVHIDDTLHLREDIENMMASTQEEEKREEHIVAQQEEEQEEEQIVAQPEEEKEEQEEEQIVAQPEEEEKEEQIVAQPEEEQEEEQIVAKEEEEKEGQDVSSKKATKRQRQKKVVQATWNDEEINAELEA